MTLAIDQKQEESQMAWSVRGHVKMISKEPIGRKLEFATVGGFSVDVDGKTIIFDWAEHSGNSTILDDGRIEIEWNLKDFDDEFFISSNYDEETTAQDIVLDWSKLTNAKLSEVCYEAYLKNDHANEEVFVEMDLSQFNVYTLDSQFNSTVYSFPKESIEAYNSLVQTRGY